MNVIMMVVCENGCGYGHGHGYGYRYDDEPYDLYDEDVDWT